MKKAPLFVLVILAVLWPSSAFAARGFWGWLEELSGPGPFHGAGVAVPVACVRSDDDRGALRCWRTDPSIKTTLVVSAALMRSGDGPRFKDLPENDPDNRGRVTAVPITAVAMFRLHRAIEVGAGAGLMRISGKGETEDNDFGFTRMLLIPASAAVTPFAFLRDEGTGKANRWKYVLRFELETSYIFPGFKGTDFKNERTRFETGPEFLTRAMAVIDFGALIF